MACVNQNNKEVVYVDNTEEPQKTLNILYEMQQDKILTDVVLIAKENGAKVPVHRIVLSARSEYFRAMFSSGMRESIQAEINLSEVSGEELENIIKYIYTGKIELSEDNIETLMATAHHYQLTDLVSACGKFVARKMDCSNCLGFWAIAELHGYTNLTKTAQEYAYDNFTDVCKSEEFLNLDDKQLRKLLASDELRVSREETIFESIIGWIQQEYVERKKYIHELLLLVRVPLLSPSFIKDQKDLILSTINDQELNKEIMTWYLTANDQLASNLRKSVVPSIPKIPTTPVVQETLVAVKTDYCFGTTPSLKYNPEIDKWIFWRHLGFQTNPEISDFGVVVMDDDFIIAGGTSEYNEVKTVRKLNGLTVNPMGTCRRFVSLVVLGSYLYAIGGFDGHNWLRSVERWHYRTGKWADVAPMMIRRQGKMAAVLNGCIFVAGGDTAETECYNPRTNSWEMRAAMHEKRDYPGVAVLNGYLYVVGGYRSKTVERYDDKTNTWTIICSLNSPREGPGCIALNNSLIVAGGWGHSTVEKYDAINNVWTQTSSLPFKGPCTLLLAKITS